MEKVLNKIYDKLTNLEQGQNEIRNDVSILKNDVSELKSDVSELKSDVSELKSDTKEIKTELRYVWHDIKSIDKRLDSQGEDIVKLKQMGN